MSHFNLIAAITTDNGKYAQAKKRLYHALDDYLEHRPSASCDLSPGAKMRYYQIGGQYEARFRLRDGADPYKLANKSAFSFNKRDVSAIRMDALDLPEMRNEVAIRAGHLYDMYERYCDLYGPVVPKKSYLEKVDVEGNYLVEDAMRDYGNQPTVRWLQEDGICGFLDDPTEMFGPTWEGYVSRAREAVIPGFAWFDLVKGWKAAGEVGPFGLTTATDESIREFNRWVNNRVDELYAYEAPLTWLFSIDAVA